MMKTYLYSVMAVWIFLTVNICIHSAVTSRKSGSYKTTLVSARRCVKPKSSYGNERTAIAYMEMYNTTKVINLLRGNITVMKEAKNIKAKAKYFRWENDKWKTNLVLRHDACGGIFIHILIAALGVPYNSKKCSVPVGTYVFKELDANKVAHMWTPSKEYGRALWRIEAFSDGSLIDCWEFVEFAEPI
ncbi:uncharacterized protein LOC128200954 [Galleria mellonella]|uniref:Uncharacterized protein LOC128200954 n=1 Tax=Galleria mellonella TaxID=7137 RepID=A0ABM3MLQ8_GALME|nr:uncharacterized protein LOC128200954 [Galleria mellonella]